MPSAGRAGLMRWRGGRGRRKWMPTLWRMTWNESNKSGQVGRHPQAARLQQRTYAAIATVLTFRIYSM